MTVTKAQRIGLVALAGIGVLALAGWLAQDLLLGKPVEALAVTQQDLVQTLDAPGSVSQPERLPLAPPVSGLVARVLVKAGDAVTKGQPLAVMEAMKMEHTITAPRDGVVAEVVYAAGDAVTEGGELLRLTAA